MIKRNKTARFVSLASLVIAMGFSSPVLAQEIERVSQGLEEAQQQPVSLTPRDNLSLSSDETELLPSLKGIVFVNSPENISQAGTSAEGVEARGDFAPDQVLGVANNFIGQPVSLASLDRLTRDLVLAFRSAGYPVVNVVVPPQDVSNGVVQILAVVGRFAELTVEGDVKNPDYYTNDFPLQPGDAVDQGKVLDHLRWRSRRFHRTLGAVYEPGAEFGQTNIGLTANETKPYTVFAGVDNTGTGITGDLRIFGGFTVADLTGEDHELSYQITTSEEGFDTLQAHVASYTVPVPFLGKTDFQVAGAVILTSADLEVGESDGDNIQVSANFRTQLPSIDNTTFDARYGLEYKNADNTFAFGGTPVSDNETVVSQGYFQLLGSRAGSKSSTQFDVGAWFSPGDVFDDNSDEAFTLTREGAEASYVYIRGGVEHVFFLPKGWRLALDADGQATGDRLITSEQIFIGGLNSVRGLEENALRGDVGILGTVQLETPAIELFGKNSDTISDGLRAYAFFDAGYVDVNDGEVEGDDDGSAISAGVGFLYQINNNFTAEGVFGYPIDTSGDVGDDDGRFSFRIVARY